MLLILYCLIKMAKACIQKIFVFVCRLFYLDNFRVTF